MYGRCKNPFPIEIQAIATKHGHRKYIISDGMVGNEVFATGLLATTSDGPLPSKKDTCDGKTPFATTKCPRKRASVL